MTARRYLSAENFKDEVKAGKPVDDVVVAMTGIGEVKAADDEPRSLRFTISTQAVDRHGDTVNPEGWDLKNYRKNPVVLWSHDYGSLPVAKASDVRVEDGVLKATATFTPPGAIRFNDIVFDLLKGGFLNAVSVGFQPKKWNWSEDDTRRMGMDFLEQELLEFSVVPVPANPQALIEARALGVECEIVKDWARKTLGITDEHEIMHGSVAAKYREEAAELRALKAAQLVEPEAKKLPRLTARALDLARLKRAI